MVREFSEEKRQEIFRLLDEIDMKDWKSFMEWCGSRKEEFGDWPDKLSVSAYTRYVDQYHEKVLEINEMTRQQVNTVFENVAEIDARYAARMREHREKVKEQIAIVKTMTEFMDSMANGNPNMALLNKGNVNENCVRTEDKKKENKEVNPPNHGREEQPLEVIVLDISGAEDQGKSILNEAEAQGIIGEAEVAFVNQLMYYIRWSETNSFGHLDGLDALYDKGLISEENYNCLMDINKQVNGSGDYNVFVLKEQARNVYTEIERVIAERTIVQKYINEDVFRDGLGWDIEAAKTNLNENFIEEMRGLMLEYGLTDERSIILFLITITKECDHGKSMIEYGDKTYYDEKSYSAEEKGAGLLQLTTYEIQMKFLEYITGREEGANFDDLLADMSPAEYISTYYSIESALWFWCVYDERITINGENYSINYAIETYGDTADFYNMFIATQCAVVGSEFWPRGIGRFFMYWNDIELSDEQYIQITMDENGKEISITHDDGSIILYYKDTEDDEDNKYPPVQSYKPTGLPDRINIYNDFIKYIEEEMS